MGREGKLWGSTGMDKALDSIQFMTDDVANPVRDVHEKL
jgi:hypothetical protein